MPTLEPSREGLTQTGKPIASTRSRQPSSPTPLKSTCAIPRSRSSRLKISLSIVTAAASTPGPDVGDVEALEQALHGPVLAERAVEDREGGVAAEQPPGGAELHLLAVAEPAPVALDHHVDHLVAGRPQPLGDGGARAQRDGVLAGAAAAQHRDPHGACSSVASVGGGRPPRAAARRTRPPSVSPGRRGSAWCSRWEPGRARSRPATRRRRCPR